MELPNLTINRLSGPVSLYYLKPDPERQREYKEQGTELPLMVLLGDIHQYRTGVCDSCYCNVPGNGKKNNDQNESKECCLPTNHTAWLKALDVLADTYPIDFYTEYSPEHTGGGKDDILFRDFIHSMTLRCHGRVERSKHTYKKCPTENIRWHYVDIRFMTNSLEGCIIRPYRALLGFLRSYKSPQGVNEQLAETQMEVSMDFTDPEAYEIGAPLMRELLTVILSNKSMTEIGTELSYRYWDLLGKHSTPEKKSFLLKQIQKIKAPLFRDVQFWKDRMTERLLEDPIFIRVASQWEMIWNQMSAGDQAMLRDQFMSLTERDRPSMENSSLAGRWEWFIGVVECLERYLLFFNTKIMDVYYLTRMLKQPDESDPGVLALGFFGDFHTRSIVEMLRHPAFGYQIQTIQAPPPEWTTYSDPRLNRCVSIQTRIPLVEDLREYTQGKNYSKYRGILSKEREARRQNAVAFQEREEKMRLAPKKSVTNFFSMIGKGSTRKGKGGKGEKGGKGKKGEKGGKGEKGDKKKTKKAGKGSRRR